MRILQECYLTLNQRSRSQLYRNLFRLAIPSKELERICLVAWQEVDFKTRRIHLLLH